MSRAKAPGEGGEGQLFEPDELRDLLAVKQRKEVSRWVEG
jgi:hypothetical protein